MYTVGYEYNETAKNSEKENFLYGLMDEQSRININYAPLETFKNLLEYFGIEPEEARGIASAIIDWRDEDGNVTSQEGVFYGAEDEYYMGLMPSYHCKNLQFDTIYELILVKGVTQDIFNKIKGHITVYGDGRVNINTADEVVLKAVFGPVFPNLASKILKYRLGPDEIIGTKDDRWFCEGPYVMDRKEEGLVAIKNLQEAEWYANIYGITTEEYNRIKELVNNAATRQLGTNSSAYRAIVTGEVKHITSRIEAVYVFEGKDKPPAVKFWHQQ
jgi:hypothetical protein